MDLSRARRLALDLRARHRIEGPPSEAELAATLSAAGLRVVHGCPFVGQVREVYADGLLGLRAGLAAGWVRWLKAHGLGHHLLHRGNHLFAANGLYLWQQQELEAELFAGTLLLGPVTPLDLSGLADAAAVPPECIRAWQAASLLVREGPGR
jgi:hypothetical protein